MFKLVIFRFFGENSGKRKFSTTFQLFLPEKSDKKHQKTSLKTMMALKEKLKLYMDDQFENALKTGDI